MKSDNQPLESYAEFSGIDFSKSKPWASAENAKAKAMFGETKNAFPYGFLLPDGRRLDLNRPLAWEGDREDISHCSIAGAFSKTRAKDLVRRAKAAGNAVEGLDDLCEEVKYEAVGAGLIRLYSSGSAYMIHIIRKPTPEQTDALYDMADRVDYWMYDRLELFVPGRGLVEYGSRLDFSRRLLNDVRNEFC